MIWRAPALCGFCDRAGFAGQDVPLAVAVALSASGGNDAYVVAPWGGSDRRYVGLWQLYAAASDTDRLTQLLDPEINAQRALTTFETAGASWEWCDGWKTGRWVHYIAEATEAARGTARWDTVLPFGTVDN